MDEHADRRERIRAFWDEIQHHWRTVGRHFQLEREPGTVRRIAEEWFQSIRHHRLQPNDYGPIFRVLRSSYSTKDALCSIKCFISVVNIYVKERAAIQGGRPSSAIADYTPTPEDKKWLPLNRFLASFSLNSAEYGAKIHNEEGQTKPDDEIMDEVLMAAYKFFCSPNSKSGYKREVVLPLLVERLALRGIIVEPEGGTDGARKLDRSRSLL